MARNQSESQLANLKPFEPGVSGNPGGMAKGKKVSTWMTEFGEMGEENWLIEGTEEYKSLPGNARIALARLRCAVERDKLGLANAQYVEPRQANSTILPIPVTKEQYQSLVSEFWNQRPPSDRP